MKRTASVLATAALLVGCSSTAKAPAAVVAQPQSRCEQIVSLVRHAWATQEEKAMAFELGRNEGCFGAPQSQPLDVTIRQAQ